MSPDIPTGSTGPSRLASGDSRFAWRRCKLWAEPSTGGAAMTDLVFYTNPQSRGRVIRWMLEETGRAL